MYKEIFSGNDPKYTIYDFKSFPGKISFYVACPIYLYSLTLANGSKSLTEV